MGQSRVVAALTGPTNTPSRGANKNVHLSGNTQYVHALGRICDGDDQPVKNREMRSLTQKGNQAKFFHRMPGIQRSPAVYNLQHLREYKSCRIWASQSRRPPYVTEVEGRARIQGVVVSIHESYVNGHGNKVAEDAVFTTPCVVIIFDEALRYREVQSKCRDRGGSPAVMWEETRPQTTFVVETRPRTRSAVARQGQPTNKIG